MIYADGEFETKQTRSEEKKSLILDTALKLFGINGFHKTTAKAIAAEAGVATGSFYRYFRDKKAVFMSVCFRLEEEIGMKIFQYGDQMRKEGLSEKEIMSSIITFSVKSHNRHKEFHREVLAMQIIDADVATWAKDRDKRIYNALVDVMKANRGAYRVKDIEAAAELTLYVIEEVSHRAIIFDSYSGEDRLISELEEMLLRYLF